MRAERSGWSLVERLGEGDFAVVDAVERAGESGAMKQATSGNVSARERLRVEHDALALLDHPSIPRVIDADLDDDAPWFVMTLAPGHSALWVVDEWAKQGRVHGPIETLRFLSQLLSALQHMQETRELVHRDIKDANVIVDHATCHATLIDFGFCKRAGVSSIRDKDSFWRAGAARFSPPGKLDDPALAVASHDVFALGVIAYRLLTGLHPWSVGTADGLAAYKRHVRSNPLVLPHEENSMVPIEVSRLVGRMLQLSDEERITTAEAHDSTSSLLADLESGSRSTRRATVQSHPHVIRDPLRGDVRLTEYEYRLLNTPEMQRLRWIRQLGLTNLVYPGADHSRLSHSIGSLERAESMLRAIEMIEGIRVDADLREQTRLYALLHDVTHIAAGHTIEDQLGFFERHDENQGRFARLLGKEDSVLGSLLRSTVAGTVTIERLESPGSLGDDFVGQAVSSPVGADVLDYLDRDAFHCGLDHRVDSAIFRQLRLYARDNPSDRKLVSTTSGKYGIRVDREFAAESLLVERYAMFLKVYTHSAKLAADAMLGKALAELAGTRGSLKEAEFESLGDETLLQYLMASKKVLVSQTAARLKSRMLPRAVFRSRILGEDEQLNRLSYADAQQHAKEEGFDSYKGRRLVELALSRATKVDASRIFFYYPFRAPGF